MNCTVNPGRTVQTDKIYNPGEALELEEAEAKRLAARGIVAIATDALSGSGGADRPNAKDSIKLAEAAETIEALDSLAEGEARSTVVAAIDKRRAELTAAQ
jgi:hypothetical protein